MATKLYLNKRFKQLRQEANMTQEDFVGMMAIWLDKPLSLSLVQKMEQGVKPINPENVLEVAKYFGVEPKEIIERR